MSCCAHPLRTHTGFDDAVREARLRYPQLGMKVFRFLGWNLHLPLDRDIPLTHRTIVWAALAMLEGYPRRFPRRIRKAGKRLFQRLDRESHQRFLQRRDAVLADLRNNTAFDEAPRPEISLPTPEEIAFVAGHHDWLLSCGWQPGTVAVLYRVPTHPLFFWERGLHFSEFAPIRTEAQRSNERVLVLMQRGRWSVIWESELAFAGENS